MGTWYDNRPCNRASPGYRRAVSALILTMTAILAIIVYVIYSTVAGGVVPGLALAALIAGGGVALFLSAFMLLESGQPAEVRFGASQFEWRTNGGKTLSAVYTSVEDIVPFAWRGDWVGESPQRYVVALFGGLVKPRVTLWLTPQNKSRMEDAIRRAGRAGRP